MRINYLSVIIFMFVSAFCFSNTAFSKTATLLTISANDGSRLLLHDSGTNKWRTSCIGQPHTLISQIARLNDLTLVTYEKRRGVLRSDDNGESWTTYPVSQPIDSFVVLPKHNVIFGYSNNIYTYFNSFAERSEDGGKTWTEFPLLRGLFFAGITSIASSPDESTTWYTTTLGEIYSSFDQGATWDKIKKGEKGWRFDSVAFPLNDRAVIYGRRTDGSDSIIGYISLPFNAGDDIQRSTFDEYPARPVVLKYVNGALFAYSYDELYISKNNGVSFKKIKDNIFTNVVGIQSVSFSNRNIVYVGSTYPGLIMGNLSNSTWEVVSDSAFSPAVWGTEATVQEWPEIIVSQTGSYVGNVCDAVSGCGANLYSPAATVWNTSVGWYICHIRWSGDWVSKKGFALQFKVLKPGRAEINVWGTTVPTTGYNYSKDKLELVKTPDGSEWSTVYWKSNHYEGSNLRCYPNNRN